ncbi:MAG: hypothetical protein QF380_08630, partial [Candidatus Marinimicrobia bacterium]|nr:hypothetical protein [Candidatus Neomarinimicrobiota bacterium]
FNISDVSITGASGGAAGDAGFTVSSSATTVVGFSLTGASIAAGSGVLTVLSFEGSGEACLSDIVVAETQNGDSMITESGDCVDIEETCDSGNYDCAGVCDGAAVEDECGVCDGDNSSCADCNGVPNGDAVEDECGVCDGMGADHECWDGSFVCDATDCSDEPAGGVHFDFGTIGDGNMEITYESSDDIAGFQFGITGVTVLGASGGAADAAGF